MNRPGLAARDWIQRSLRAEHVSDNDSELLERADAVDAIARAWNVPTEVAVAWVHSASAKSSNWSGADFTDYCKVYAAVKKERSESAIGLGLPNNWPS